MIDWLKGSVTRRNGAWKALALMAALGLAGCGSPAVATSSSTPSELTIALSPQSPLDWWPPLVPTINCGTVSGGGISGPDMYLPVLWISSKDTIDYSQSIAQSITVSNNDQTYTIRLNPKWHWSNGQPVTAQNVLFDWKLIDASSQPTSVLPYCFASEGGVPSQWKSVTVNGPYTLTVSTTSPVNPTWFELNGLAQLVPVPSAWDKYSSMTQELHFIDKLGNEPLNPIFKIVDGPYDISQYVPDQYWLYKANPNFDGNPKPAIPKISYQYEGSSDTTFAAVLKGSVDIAPISFSLLKSIHQAKGYHLVTQPLFGYFMGALNMRPNAQGVGGLFAKLYARQALQLGIDQPAIIRAVYHGYATPTYGPVPVRPANVFYDKGLKNPYPYDPARGKALLEANGWRMQNGVLEKGGHKLAFQILYPSGDQSSQDIAQILKADWGQEGIDATLNPQSIDNVSNDIGSVSNSSKWVVQIGFKWSYEPDYYPSGDGLFNSLQGFNPGAYQNARMTRLIDQSVQGGTAAQITERFNAYQIYASQQLPVLWMPTPDGLFLEKNTVHGWGSAYNDIQAFVPNNDLSFSK
ncbi:MAG: peptide ABC transporter substrate-binding protein [Clostridia bacterium]